MNVIVFLSLLFTGYITGWFSREMRGFKKKPRLNARITEIHGRRCK